MTMRTFTAGWRSGGLDHSRECRRWNRDNCRDQDLADRPKDLGPFAARESDATFCARTRVAAPDPADLDARVSVKGAALGRRRAPAVEAENGYSLTTRA
jgi:hypothetical protein